MPWNTYKSLYRIASLLLFVFLVEGCAHYTIQAPEPNPAGQTHTVTLYSYFWGAIEPTHSAIECDITDALDVVRARDNLAYDFISVITLGVIKPMEMEYKCSAGKSPVGQRIGGDK